MKFDVYHFYFPFVIFFMNDGVKAASTTDGGNSFTVDSVTTSVVAASKFVVRRHDGLLHIKQQVKSMRCYV